jgi:hypothetical protein
VFAYAFISYFCVFRSCIAKSIREETIIESYARLKKMKPIFLADISTGCRTGATLYAAGTCPPAYTWIRDPRLKLVSTANKRAANGHLYTLVHRTTERPMDYGDTWHSRKRGVMLSHRKLFQLCGKTFYATTSHRLPAQQPIRSWHVSPLPIHEYVIHGSNSSPRQTSEQLTYTYTR